jgi:exonuclease-1
MLVGELKSRGIKFIIAPYEADAQLAYLSRNGIVDVVITEDSDLLAFGAKKIFYKFDFFTLDGE